ncbi:DUF72 domain-containing protein [Herbaspirillum sp. YR522]|uniref:DUF72 domain-containing protein n=1 Tax=Herbaspirillum sp. YR522 TaxID=1144342 RepID=UPI00026F7F99|nr:DUF72 domain-containing protein [Herbaspirillum sp. YR522]EJN03251.1 hypothetical protein PMI40_02800 [Herbaspirillum sp. YR522]
MGKIHIGISGWRYTPWRGSFYPEGLRQADELGYASRALPSIELNGSFYALQRPESYQQWYDSTPAGFVFSHKGNRYITHTLRLRGDIESALANVFASGVFNLREKLGPFLWQFPPSFVFDAELMEHFLALLPHDTEQAQALARGHEPRMKGRVQLEVDRQRRVRHAVEIRHDSFVDPVFIRLLRKYKVALVVADAAKKWPSLQDVTADFLYLRLHGDKRLYESGYSDQAIDDWTQRIGAWAVGKQPENGRRVLDAAPPRRAQRDIYCYFDNDIKVRAPFDARRLIERLALPDKLIALGSLPPEMRRR